MTKLLYQVRDTLLCMPTFHPTLGPVERRRGIVSGSGLTSSIGSLCMYSMHTLALINYCKMYKINIFRTIYFVYVSSDDSMLYTHFELNVPVYISIFRRLFGMELEHELTSKPGVDHAFFLGSEWLDGKPYRDVNRLFARIIFGSPDLPYTDEYTLFCS